METIQIETAQNISLEYEIASVGDRIIATLIDFAIYIGWMILCSLVQSYVHLGSVVSMTIFLFPLLFYFLLCEIFLNGQSLGKRAMNTRVVKVDGSQPSIGAYLMRWIFRPIEIIASGGGIALITVVINGRGQRLGDIAAGTCVVKLKQRVTLRDAMVAEVDENYKVVFSEVSLLNDKDISVIKQLFEKSIRNENSELMHDIANKIKSVTGVSSSMFDRDFVNTVLKDYQHIASGEKTV